MIDSNDKPPSVESITAAPEDFLHELDGSTEESGELRRPHIVKGNLQGTSYEITEADLLRLRYACRNQRAHLWESGLLGALLTAIVPVGNAIYSFLSYNYKFALQDLLYIILFASCLGAFCVLRFIVKKEREDGEKICDEIEKRTDIRIDD